jgi:hypothetical protein
MYTTVTILTVNRIGLELKYYRDTYWAPRRDVYYQIPEHQNPFNLDHILDKN